MSRVKGLSNEHYAERKTAITRNLKKAFGECLSGDEVPADMLKKVGEAK